MDLPSALRELADMLTIAAEAAQRLVKQAQSGSSNGETFAAMAEVSEIADRLREIGEKIRKAEHSRSC